MTASQPVRSAQFADLEVLRFIERSAQLSQRQLASSLGMSLGRANRCVRELVLAGFVKVEHYRSSTRKVACLYLLTPHGVVRKAELTERSLRRKMVEYERLRREIDELRSESESLAAHLAHRPLGTGHPVEVPQR